MSKIYVVIAIYFIVTFLVARYFSKKESLQDYFLNNKSSSLWLLIFSNVATIIWAWLIITVISATYSSWISFGITTMFSLLCGAIMIWLLAKKIVNFWNKHNIYSIVDFFEKRFDRKNQILVFILQLLLLIIRTTIQIIWITYLINILTDIDYHLALFISAWITILYTAIGGLKIDIITDFIQFWIITIVFIIMTIVGYQQIWWLHNLIAILPAEMLNPLNFWGIWFLIGIILFWGLIYIPNTSHRQRILSAKNEKIARKSFFRSIPFLLIIIVMIIFLWLIASVTLTGINPDTAIFKLIYKLLSNEWLIWLWFSCVLAVIMSSLDSLLIAGSTIIYKWWSTNRFFQRRNQLIKAKLLTWGFGILCLIIATFIPDIITLSLLCSYLTLIFVPAIIAWFYFPRVSSNASFYSILIPTIILLSTYFIIWKNTFLISTATAIVIIVFYDKFFKKRDKQILTEKYQI